VWTVASAEFGLISENVIFTYMLTIDGTSAVEMNSFYK